MKYFVIIFIVMFLFAGWGPIDKSNRYIIHSKKGDITCYYHNSRDYEEFIGYYPSLDKSQYNYMHKSCIDSITIISENFWTCGPKDDSLIYIDKRPKNE